VTLDPIDPTPSPGPGEADLVTVVIPARNEERFIRRCLDSVLAQTYPNLEILVVDGDSDDRTREIVAEVGARYPSVHLLSNPQRIVPSSLNVGLAHARGRWFVRIDAHATVVPDYVERAIAHLSTGEWSAVGGRVDPIGDSAAGRAIAVAMCSRFGIGNSVHHYGTDPVATDHVPFPGYPTELLRTLGGWNESLAVNQDFELDWRVVTSGGRVLYDPAMAIDYYGQQSVRGLFRQFRRYGRGKVLVIALHPRSAHVRHFAAPTLVAALVVSAGVALAGHRRLGFVIPAAYAAGLGAATADGVRQLRHDGASQARLPLVFGAMHIGWGIGFWEGLGQIVSRKRRTQ
jgi:glycosyltransferase involved in cell wall biosynthesis